MVAANQHQNGKKQDKIPVSSSTISIPKLVQEIKNPTSPICVSLEDEVLVLRARNKILTDALKAVKDAADQHAKTNHELVWYARNRSRYPNHEARKRVEASEELSDEIVKLRTNDGDYHHGFHSGVLASARLFQEHSDILDVNEHTKFNDDLLVKAVQHNEKIEHSKHAFPHLDVDEAPGP